MGEIGHHLEFSIQYQISNKNHSITKDFKSGDYDPILTVFEGMQTLYHFIQTTHL